MNDARRVLAWLGLAVAPVCLGILAVAFAYGPDAIAAGAPLADLGFPVASCPGCALCGLSRAFAQAAAGRFDLAVSLNPLVLVAWPAAWLLGVVGPILSSLHLLRSR